MPTLVSVAAAIAAAGGLIQSVATPLNNVRFGKLYYEIRAIYRSDGLSGLPPYCADEASDMVMVVYTVRNDTGTEISGAAVPHLFLTKREGAPLSRSERYSEALALKVDPPMLLPSGRLPVDQRIVQADVFVTPRNLIYTGDWKLRVGRVGTEAILLPELREAQAPECPRLQR